MADLMKEKEEVKEYLKNLGIEYRFSCYSEKNLEGCQLLGDYFNQITREIEKANKVFKENCDVRNYGRSCSSYALNLFQGRGCEKNIAESLEYFSKACENDDALGCDYAGKLLSSIDKSSTKFIKTDSKKGLSYLERGCNLGTGSQMYESGESCYAAAFLYGAGIAGVAKDYQKSIDLGVKACELGKMDGCKLASEIYHKLGNAKLGDKYMDIFKSLEKQIKDGAGIQMQRT